MIPRSPVRRASSKPSTEHVPVPIEIDGHRVVSQSGSPPIMRNAIRFLQRSRLRDSERKTDATPSICLSK